MKIEIKESKLTEGKRALYMAYYETGNRKGYSIRNVAKLSDKGMSTVQRVKRLLKVQSSQ